ncbi:MAG: tetratricopeptide repeat protein [Gammaproteobacteria bacterium]|nr:tetratricopeptide repeat protein [Gammaproteobacteria bacterium]
MSEIILRVFVSSLLLILSACAIQPSGTRVPVEQRSPQQQPSTDAEPREKGGAPVESRLPEPDTEIETLPPPGKQDMKELEAPVQAPPEPAEQPQASSAVVALLETAREQAAAGDDEQAAAHLERALRIEPKNPWLWHRLGVLRLQQGDYQAAIDLANKSNALAAGNRRLMAGNWELLARAYTALGRDAEAERARRNARELQAPYQG